MGFVIKISYLFRVTDIQFSGSRLLKLKWLTALQLFAQGLTSPVWDFKHKHSQQNCRRPTGTKTGVSVIYPCHRNTSLMSWLPPSVLLQWLQKRFSEMYFYTGFPQCSMSCPEWISFITLCLPLQERIWISACLPIVLVWS